MGGECSAGEVQLTSLFENEKTLCQQLQRVNVRNSIGRHFYLRSQKARSLPLKDLQRDHKANDKPDKQYCYRDPV
jgi:hypothetical protein